MSLKVWKVTNKCTCSCLLQAQGAGVFTGNNHKKHLFRGPPMSQDLSLSRGTAALFVTQGLPFCARLYFAITDKCAVQLCCPHRIGSVTSAGVGGTPQLWGRATKPRVHRGCSQGGIRMWIIQQWIFFFPKLKVAGGPLCLTAMKGLNHSKMTYFCYLFPFESQSIFFAIGFSLMT